MEISAAGIAQFVAPVLSSPFWTWFSGWLKEEREGKIRLMLTLPMDEEHLTQHAALRAEVSLIDRVLQYPLNSVLGASQNLASEPSHNVSPVEPAGR